MPTTKSTEYTNFISLSWYSRVSILIQTLFPQTRNNFKAYATILVRYCCVYQLLNWELSYTRKKWTPTLSVGTLWPLFRIFLSLLIVRRR